MKEVFELQTWRNEGGSTSEGIYISAYMKGAFMTLWRHILNRGLSKANKATFSHYIVGVIWSVYYPVHNAGQSVYLYQRAQCVHLPIAEACGALKNNVRSAQWSRT